jgi:hypothetical protein
MSVGQPFRFPPDKWEQREKLRRVSCSRVVMLLLARVFNGRAAVQSLELIRAGLSVLL